jgi:hypothetical protein
VAYLTATILQEEAAWWFTAWQPVITSTSAFTTWLGTIVTRAAKQTEWRIGATAYNNATALEQEILKEAELCIAMYYLCLASAAIADTSDDSSQNPNIAHGDKLRADAWAYKDRYYEILAPFDTETGKPGWAKPKSTTSTGTTENIPEFEADVQYEEEGTP